MGLKKLFMSIGSICLVLLFATALVWVSGKYEKQKMSMSEVIKQEKDGSLIEKSEKRKNFLKTELSPVTDSKLADIRITTQKHNGIISSEQFVTASCEVFNAGTNNTGKRSGAVKILEYDGKIEKKPSLLFTFKEEEAFFGKKRGTQFTLLSGYRDKTLLRTLLTARLYGFLAKKGEYTPFARLVNVSVDGQYQGVYLLCEKIEASEKKINISDIAALTPQQSAYLLKQEGTADSTVDNMTEGEEWFWLRRENRRIQICSPDLTEQKKKEYAVYIKEVLDNTYDAVLAKDWAQIKMHLDLPSTVRTFLTAEIINASDKEHVSIYFYKNASGKLAFGPVTGVEYSFGGKEQELDHGMIYGELLEIPEFQKEFIKAYRKYHREAEVFLQRKIDKIMLRYQRDLENDYSYWEKNTAYGSEKMKNATTYEQQITLLHEWINARFTKMTLQIGEEE